MPLCPLLPGLPPAPALLESSGKRIDALLRPNAAKTEGCSESGERSQSLLAPRAQGVRERSPSMTGNICVDPTPRRLGGWATCSLLVRNESEPSPVPPQLNPWPQLSAEHRLVFPSEKSGHQQTTVPFLHPAYPTNPCWLLGASLQTPPPPPPRGCWGLAGVTEKRVFSSEPRHGAN